MQQDLNKIICHCMSVTVGDIKSAIENGATTFQEVQDATQCSTVCGNCKPDVEALIAEFTKK